MWSLTVCAACSANKVKLKDKSIRVCDDCFVSFDPDGGGKRGFKPVGGTRGNLNSDGYSSKPPSKAIQQTPAQALLGTPAASTSPNSRSPKVEEQSYETYQNMDDATAADPSTNAKRQLVSHNTRRDARFARIHANAACSVLSQYESPLAENPNKCCCVIC